METNNDYTQLCVWSGCLVGEDRKDELTAFMKSEAGVRIMYAEEIFTLANRDGEGGRNDLLFYIHNADIPKFALKRFEYDGISWWEDALENWGEIYPTEIKSKYPKTW